MPNIVIDNGDTFIVILPEDELSIRTADDPRNKMKAGLEVTLDQNDLGDFILGLEIILIHKEDLLGPEFSELHLPTEERLAFFVQSFLNEPRLSIHTTFNTDLSPAIVAKTAVKQMHELRIVMARWCAEYLAKNFEYVIVVERDPNDRNIIIATCICTFLPTEESKEFEFRFAISDIEKKHLDTMTIEAYFGIAYA